ncbi:Long-chain-fatty-acid--CoA ligase [Halioglobus japonicus]|nr:Long-chain-fatty-acid--CoA ligase [Halioglobus japonicus]
MTEPNCEQLHHIIARQASLQPGGIALWWQGAPVDYATLQHNIAATAAGIAGTGATGDRIAVLSWNCPEFVELIYAIPAAGRIMVPLNARLAPAELIYQLRSSEATCLFGDRALLTALQGHADFPADTRVVTLDAEYVNWRATTDKIALPQTRADDPTWILFTSGSTGRPKGAVLTHQSFMAGLRSAALARPVEATDKYYYPFPLFHVAAHNVLLQHLYGAAVVLARSFDATDTLQTCRELKVTTMSLAPTMIGLLLDHPDFHAEDLASVRTIGYGASAMPQTLLQRLLAQTSVGLCQSYGMTELSGSVAFLTVEDHREAAHNNPELLRSVGRPLPTAQLKLIDDSGAPSAAGEAGEILVQAEQCMQGYWQDADATKKAITDGWLHTGDIGRFDEAGYLFIVDRKKDMIISGGENIASREIEEVLRRHPDVADCAVIGLVDPKWGESACALVRLTRAISDQALTAHCRKLLAGYKTPKRWIRIDELPLNASGKVDKPLLRQTYSR